MSSIAGYWRWMAYGSCARETPRGSRLTWGRLVVAWGVATVLAALVFAGLAAGGLLSGMAVALLWAPAQAAVLVGLVYAAGFPAGSARRTD